ncbi:hypothetical protein Hanom_Chr13g01213551 [Helianthus anomalus]
MVSGTGISIMFTKPVIFFIPYRYRLLTFSISVWHRFLPSNTGTVPVPTGTEPYRASYIRYQYPLLGIFCNGIFCTGWYRAHQIL